ncbi:hypothetical protein ACJDU8_14440 [Clostridium sp. WILCCON 0269]|uniref:Uncharacterized protein n=1 Tax=Candidatus Clostridium eludens TaxID=3381663 RepID=A0ABW8SL35_9CLOT
MLEGIELKIDILFENKLGRVGKWNVIPRSEIQQQEYGHKNRTLVFGSSWKESTLIISYLNL